MKVTMREYYQDARQVLQLGSVYEVSDELGAWLVEHRKAEAVQPEVNAVPEARHLDVEPQFEAAEEPPQPKPRKRGKQ
jgi:hypothetical protein